MKHNYRRTILIGFAFLSISAFWNVYENIIPLILKNTFGYKETFTNIIMALDNVLALFLLPLFGSLSDKTNTRYGKRTPYIILGTLCAVAFMLLIPIANNIKSFVLFFIALGVVLLAMSTYRSPAVALMPDLTPKRHRSKANAIINLMGALGYVYSLVATLILVPKLKNPDYLPLFISIAILMLASIIVLKLTINEKKLSENMKNEDPDFCEEPVMNSKKKEKLPRDVFKSLVLILSSVFLWFCAYNAVTTAYSRYAEEIWGLEGGSFASSLLIASVAATISYIPIGFISSRIGRKKTILIGVVFMFIAFFIGSFIANLSSMIYVVFALTGIGWAAINVNSYPMVVEMSKGYNIGVYTGYYYTFSMAAQIFTPILSGIFLQYVGYRTLFPYATIFMVFAFITMNMVKHGDSKPLPKKEIVENFDVED